MHWNQYFDMLYYKENPYSCISLLSLAHTCDANANANANASANVRKDTCKLPWRKYKCKRYCQRKEWKKKIFLRLRLRSLPTRVNRGRATQTQMQTKSTGYIGSMPLRDSSKQDEVNVFRHFRRKKLRRARGNFLFFSTAVSRNLNNSKWSLLEKMGTKEVGLKKTVCFTKVCKHIQQIRRWSYKIALEPFTKHSLNENEW